MPLFEDTNWDGTPPNLGADYSRVVSLTSAEIAAPTSQQLEDIEAIYHLNVSPFTRYYSNGTSLVEVLNSAQTTAQIGSLQSQINALAAIVGAGGSPSKPTVTANTVFAGALAVNTQQTITPAKWSGSTVTISNASPAVVTWASHGLLAGSELIFNTTGALPTGLTAGAVYFVSATGFTSGSFQVSATSGGASINTSSAGSGTHTVDGVVPSARVWHVYINGSIDSATPNRTTTAFTPATGHAGLPVFVIEEATARNGSGQVQSTSAPVVVDAPPVFSITVVQATISGTEGQAITPVAPVVATGGTGSITYTTTPNLSGTGFSINSATGVISGTRTVGLGALTTTYTVNAQQSPPDFISASFTFNIAAASVSTFSPAAYPAATNITGYSGSYNGSTAISVSGTVRVGPSTDASGTVVDLHRIVQSGATIQRAEVLHLSPSHIPLICQHEYWMAFAVKRFEPQPSAGPDTECLVFQTHTSMSGATQPDLALFDNGQGDIMRWRASGCPHSGLSHDPGDAGYVNPWITDGETRPAVGVWWRYIVKYKPGWESGHDKILKIWRGKPVEDMANITTGGVYTGINTYNDGNNGLTAASYPRKGLYKYDGVNWSASTVSYYISRLYFEENTLGSSEATMLARATASVAWAR